MKPLDIIYDHYRRGSRQADILIRHSEQVRDKALDLARRVPQLKPDPEFIAEAAMLHDIGICGTDARSIHCRGDRPYVCHGVIGRQILEQYGLEAHALVCERHVGAGLSRREIDRQQLPLPRRDMLPRTIEEIIICYADGFFSKTAVGQAHTLAQVTAEHARYGRDPLQRFLEWHSLFHDDANRSDE